MGNKAPRKTALNIIALVCFIIALPNRSIRSAQAPARDIASELLLLKTPPSYDVRVSWANVGKFIHPYPCELPPPPSLDAPLGVWANHDWMSTFRDHPEKLTDPLRVRLLEACEAYPWNANDLVRWIPQTPEAFARIKALLDKTPEDAFRYRTNQWVIAYLSQNSEYFRPRLIAAAKAVREGPGWVNNVDDLKALARLDWEQAAPILRSYAASQNPRTTALALSLQYRHAVEFSTPDVMRLRTRLRAIAEDRSATGYARNFAIEALMSSDWEGCDEWFLSLLRDRSLHFLVDDVSSFAPLEEPVHRDPSKWIPRIAPLVNSSDSNIRRGAIYILVSFQQRESRPDAALPLLPWLFDPHWVKAGDSGHDRLNLIYSLSRMRVPESVPGLIHVLENPAQAGVWEIRDAAVALGQFRDSRAVPVLRQVLEQSIRFEERQGVARILLASGDVTLDEKVRAVEAFLQQVKNPAGREQVGRADMLDDEKISIDGKVVLGLTVLQTQGEDGNLRGAMRKQGAALRRLDPQVADQFDAVLAILPAPDRDRQLIYQIREGSASAAMVRAALERAPWLRMSVPDELREAANGQGAPAGIAAALLDDEIRVFEILDGHDRNAQRALLASALLGGPWLNEQQVLRLMGSADAEVGEAAGAYYQATHWSL